MEFGESKVGEWRTRDPLAEVREMEMSGEGISFPEEETHTADRMKGGELLGGDRQERSPSGLSVKEGNFPWGRFKKKI